MCSGHAWLTLYGFQLLNKPCILMQAEVHKSPFQQISIARVMDEDEDHPWTPQVDLLVGKWLGP